MAVYLDIKSRLDVRLAEAAAREAVDLFHKAGDDINKGLSGAISKALGSFDSSAMRREVLALQDAYRNAADVETAAADRMVAALGRVEAAQARLNEMTAKYGADSSRALAATVAKADADAVAAKATRDHVDAMVAAEAGHQKLTKATGDTAAETNRAAQVWNGVGAASLAAYGAAIFETTKKAGDFQASQTRLVASAGETQQNLKAVSDGILQLAGQVGYSAQDLSNAMYTVEKAGYRGSDGVNVLKAAAQGAKSENSDLGEVLNGLTTSMHDFNFSQDQAADVMSRMVQATSMAKAMFQHLSGALHSAEPIAANLGQSQNLDPQQMQHLMSDVMGIGAQMTQTGMSTNQAFDLMGHAYQKFLGPTQGMRDMLGALGIDAQDLSDHLGERGLAQTMQIVSQAIQDHTKNGMVDLDVHYQSAQAARAETEAFNALPEPAQKVAQAIKDGTLSYTDFRKTKGGLNVEMANEVGQWNALNNKLTGFSSAIKSGIGDQMSMDQALKMATGDQETLQVAMQTTGENAGQTNDKIKQLDETTREHDGTVKGFNETQETLNAKLADAKAAFGAAAIEMGSVFVPIMTDVANVAKTVGDAMAQHPRIAHDVINALGLLGGAWLAFKGLNVAETILTPIATSLGTIVAGEEGATAATTALGSAMSGLAAAVPVVAGAALEANSQSNAMKQAGMETPEEIGQKQGSWAEIKALFHQTFWADGGAISGPGPKGKDSVPAWMAPGEHVLTASDVDAMGGQANVYSFRNALHRAGGGGAESWRPTVEEVVDQYGPEVGITAGNREAWVNAIVRQIGIESGGNPNADNPNDTDGRGGRQHVSGLLQYLPSSYAMSGGKLTGLPYMNPVGQIAGALFAPRNAAGLPSHLGQGGGWGPVATAINGGAAPMGGDGYTSAGSDKLYAAQDKVGRLEDRIKELEKRISEETVKTKQSEKDKLDDELKRAQDELAHAKDRLAEVEQEGPSSSGRGRRGSKSGGTGKLQFGAPLPENFGLGKGIPGFFEWLTTFAADMAIGPIEGGMLGDAIRSGQISPEDAQAMLGGDSSGTDTGGTPGGYADLGDQGTASLAEQYSPMSDSSGGYATPSGGGGSSGSGGSSAWTPSGGIPGLSLALGARPGAPSSPAPGGIKPWDAAILKQNGIDPTTLGPAPAPAPGRQMYGPPSPAASLSPDTLDKLHSIDGAANINGPTHVDAAGPALPPDTIPRTPSGGIDYGALKSRFSGSVPLFPQAPPTSNYAKSWYQLPGEIPGFATGGPTGTDTIPAWLSPGEFVMNSQATKNNLAALQFMNAGHYDVGSFQPLQPAPAPKPAPSGPPPPKPNPSNAPKPKPGDGKPQGPPQGTPHIPVGGPSSPGPGNLSIPGGSDTQKGLQAPGASTHQFGQDLPASGGIGFGGGIIGGAEGAASMAASMGAAMGGGGGAGAGAGMQAAFQLMNRTAGYVGQLGGIAAEGIIKTILPSDSSLSDFANTLPGKLIAGVAGVRPGTPNSAGKSEAPLKPKEGEGEKGGGDSHHVGQQFNAPITVKADNPDSFRQQMSRQFSAAQAQYPMKTP